MSSFSKATRPTVAKASISTACSNLQLTEGTAPVHHLHESMQSTYILSHLLSPYIETLAGSTVLMNMLDKPLSCNPCPLARWWPLVW